jgi:hypothetical protein
MKSIPVKKDTRLYTEVAGRFLAWLCELAAHSFVLSAWMLFVVI